METMMIYETNLLSKTLKKSQMISIGKIKK